MAQENEPLLLSKADAAEKLGVSIRTIENLIARCELASIPIGRRRMIPLTTLITFVRRRTRLRAEEVEAAAE